MTQEEVIKQFVAYGYATDALKFARFDCDQLSRIVNTESMEWLSIVTSLVTHYSRPFKMAKRMAPLESSFVSADHFALHQRLLLARDKAHAHLDGDLAAIPDGSALHQIRLVKQADGKHFWCPSRVLLFEPVDIPSIASLIESLLARLNKETDVLETLILPSVTPLPAGLYLLSPVSPFFTRDRRHDGIDTLEDLGPIH